VRVVSLTCSNTEIVAALGCAHLLVGCDSYSDWPEEVVGPLPRLGKDLDIDVAAVVGLAPDLVLASLTVPGHEKVVAEVAAAGLRYVAPAPVSLADVYRDVRDIAALLGVPERGEALVASMIAAMPPVDVDEADRPGVLVEWWPKPVIVPGRRSWVSDVIRLAGGRNPWEGRDRESTPLTDDEVVAAAPDAVVVSWCGVEPKNYRLDKVTGRSAWASVPALRDGRVHAVPEAFLGRPGPRLVEGYAALRAILGTSRSEVR